MPELTAPRITNVVCLEVTERSGGNAVGVGLADFVPRRLLEGFDPLTTYANTLTAGSQGVQRAQIPIVLDSDVDAVKAAILTCDVPLAPDLRLARIRNTLHLDELLVTEALVDEAVAGGYDAVGTTHLFDPSAGGGLAGW
jgi:hypothetical protein